MLRIHIQVVGAMLLALGFAHVFFSRYFGWKKELAAVSLLTRRIFQVHCFFISLVLVLLGTCSLFYPDRLLESSPLSRVLLAGIVFFWLCRLIIQFVGYDAAIWKGNRFYTAMHVFFSVLWSYIVITYGMAFRHVLNG